MWIPKKKAFLWQYKSSEKDAEQDAGISKADPEEKLRGIAKG
jgi:hypothetical protein